MSRERARFIRIEIILGRIFLVLLSLSAGYFLCETVLRYREKSSPPPIGYKLMTDETHYPRPYVMSSGKPFWDDHNVLGYRGPLPDKDKPPGEYRIFFLGGSTVYHGNIPLLLEKKFREKGFSGVRIFNFGAVSSNSTQDVIRILLDVASFKPDLILMYGGGNDLLEIERPGYPHRFRLYEINPLWAQNVEEYKALPLLLYGQLFFRKFFPHYFTRSFVEDKSRLSFYLPIDYHGDAYADIYLESLRKGALLARMLKSDFIAFFQPLLDDKVPLSEKEKTLSLYASRIGNLQKLKTRKDQVWKRYEEEFKKEFPLIDLRRIFQGNSQDIFSDNIHIWKEHSPIVVDHLYRELLRRPSPKAPWFKTFRRGG